MRLDLRDESNHVVAVLLRSGPSPAPPVALSLPPFLSLDGRRLETLGRGVYKWVGFRILTANYKFALHGFRAIPMGRPTTARAEPIISIISSF